MWKHNGMMWNWNEFCEEEIVLSDNADLCSHWETHGCNAQSQGLNQKVHRLWAQNRPLVAGDNMTQIVDWYIYKAG